MELVSDAKYTNIQLVDNGRHLIYIGDLPLLVYNENTQSYVLNVDENNHLKPAIPNQQVALSKSFSQEKRIPRSNVIKPPPKVKPAPRVNPAPKVQNKTTSRTITKEYTPRTKYFSKMMQNSTSDDKLYYGDLDEDGRLTALDALEILKIVVNKKSIDDFADINGIDRRVLAYVRLLPNEYTSNLETNTSTKINALDALEILRYVVKKGYPDDTTYENPVEYIPLPVETPSMTPSMTMSMTPTPTSTPEYNTTLQVGENWQINTEETGLKFKHNDEIVAEIVPSETGETISLSDFPNNEVLALSPSWSIMYPGLLDENESDESPSKQLKFIYKGYPQTLIMPIVGESNGLSSFNDAHINFGSFWTLVSNSGEMIKFFYRKTRTEMYYPQVVIGTSQATLSRYLVQARKIQI